MKRVMTVVGVIAAFVVTVMSAGCATMKKNDTELQTLKTQVTDLETKVQRKDAEIDSLRQALSKTTEEKYTEAKGSTVSTQVPTPLQIQKALKGAGYDPGEIDGKLGTQTRKAIRSFQKANNLTSDGKVGPKTWSLLSAYLDKK